MFIFITFVFIELYTLLNWINYYAFIELWLGIRRIPIVLEAWKRNDLQSFLLNLFGWIQICREYCFIHDSFCQFSLDFAHTISLCVLTILLFWDSQSLYLEEYGAFEFLYFIMCVCWEPMWDKAVGSTYEVRCRSSV